ncbi:Bet v I domain [Macleaya cordata]|uniref:Bet v I domain n=1 Tax=Macleaya cordata TaxID=56857 RepID=A0A200PU16_MACCD|nr:Bet v I domain [Macleaya cordata]
MAQIHRQQVETEVKCSADQFYDLYKNNSTQLFMIFPQSYKAVQVLEGDGKSVGSVRLWKCELGRPGNIVMAKDKVKAVDDESRSLTLSVIEGDLLSLYRNFEAKLTVTPKDGDKRSCLVKWAVEFEKENENDPNPDAYLEFAAAISKELGPHLIK